MTKFGVSPSQTVGPFFHYGLTPEARGYTVPVSIDAVVAAPGTLGTPLVLTGVVTDADGAPVPDALIELWQADHNGIYAHPRDGRANASNSFRGFGRSPTALDGTYRFETIRPGAVSGPGGSQAPHVALVIFARGMLTHLFTRAYFEGEAANTSDPVLALVPETRRDTLIAKATGNGVYRFDIRLQGDKETVFFAV